jgi:hypothetical protein
MKNIHDVDPAKRGHPQMASEKCVKTLIKLCHLINSHVQGIELFLVRCICGKTRAIMTFRQQQGQQA